MVEERSRAQYEQSEYAHYDDEGVDLGWIASVLWRRRGQFLRVLAAVTVVFWLLVGLKGLLLEARVVRYVQDIKLVFQGADQNEYPDGTLFSPSNIVAPVILNAVYENNQLGDLDVAVDAFVNAFSAQGYAPESDFIVQRYRDLLENRSLSGTEIGALEEQFSQELEQASRSGVRIVLTMPSGMLVDEMARKVLDDVPLAWQRYMTERRGVFETDAPFVTAKALDMSLLERADYLVLYDIIRNRLEDALANITGLRMLSNSDNIVDPETGLGLADLESVLRDLRDFSLEQVATFATGFGISRDPVATTRYFRKRIEDLTRQRQLLNNKATLVAETFDRYTATDQPAGSRDQGAGTADLFGGGTTIPQFGSDFLDRLVELGSSSGDVQFRQELSRERLDFGLEAADLESEVNRLEELVRRLSGSDQGRSAGEYESLEEKLATDLETARTDLIRLMEAISRIRAELESFNYGTDETLYRDLGTAVGREESALVLTTANTRSYAVLMVLLAMGMPALALLQETIAARRSESKSPSDTEDAA